MKVALGEAIPANLFRGIEAVGGKIIFLEQGIKFNSHSLNIQTGEVFIPYNQILNIKKRNTLLFVPNGISIITRDGSEFKFVVYKRNEIIDFILKNQRNG